VADAANPVTEPVLVPAWSTCASASSPRPGDYGEPAEFIVMTRALHSGRTCGLAPPGDALQPGSL